MSNVKVREDGCYLAQMWELSCLQVVSVLDDEVLINGGNVVYTVEDFHWIADVPLDLERVKFITENYEVFVD